MNSREEISCKGIIKSHLRAKSFALAVVLGILALGCPLKGEVGGFPSRSGANLKYNILFGINYSNYTTTNGYGRTGVSAGFYRKIEISRSFALQFGLSYTIKKVDLLDKKIRSDSFTGGQTLWISDILGDFQFVEINSIIKYRILKQKLVSVSSLLGIGYSANIRYATEIKNKSEFKRYDTPFEIYDYEYANEGYPPMLANKGYILHAGIEAGTGSYFLDFLYSYDLFDITRPTVLLLFEDGERLHSTAVLLGKSF